jgi:hypothetical protein
MEVGRIVRAALGPRHDVMDLESARGPTSRRLAPPTITSPHEAYDARRNVLGRAYRCRVRGRPDVLRIAECTLDGTPYATGAYGGVANLGYTVGGNLVDNATGGWACGLAKLGGKFMSSSYGDKVAIGYNGTTKFWNWTLVNGKQAEAVCVK